MLVQYLISTVKKSKEEMLSFLESFNIKGNILVGNQAMDKEYSYSISTKEFNAIIYNIKSIGVSRNRNYLINKSDADYVTFLDDDMCFNANSQNFVEEKLKKKIYNCVRFNGISDNKNRPIKVLKKYGFVGFRKLSSFGVWGCFYKLDFLKNNNLYFREDVGPGTEINHGEDGLFNKEFTKFSKVYNMPNIVLRARQEVSTWHDDKRDLNKEMISHGFIYYFLYEKSAKLMTKLFVNTHMHCYPKGTTKSFLKNKMYEGIALAKTKKNYRHEGFRVLILGPVVNEKVSGGVAVFTEGLYKGFKEIGDEVNIISISKSSTINNISINKKNPYSILFNFNKIAKLIKKYQPDLVISSLQYSLGIKKYKKKWPHAKYIQVLHGAPCPINGKFKAWSVNYVARYSRKYFDKVVTVSYLSYAINKKMNLIECDKVIHNGCELIRKESNAKREYDIVYIGRLYKDKEIELICDSFLELLKFDKKLKLCVAGYGELEYLFTKGKYKNSGIIFLGKLNQDKVRETLSNSKFFISMNPLEPFATSYNEAIVNGCNIITQSTVGSASLFFYKNYFHIVDCITVEELLERLKVILNSYHKIPEQDIKFFINYFSYKRVANDYKKLIKK